MRFEPLLYFAALLDSKGEIIKFAECDINTNLPFSAIYCFNEIIENSYFIDTIWYDCYLKEYSHCRLRLNDYNINNQIIKIELCYLTGFGLCIYIIYNNKSCLFLNREIEKINSTIIEKNNEWKLLRKQYQEIFNLNEQSLNEDILLVNQTLKRFTRQYLYRYVIIFNYKKDSNLKIEESDFNKFEYIENSLVDGTYDKLHDTSLLNHHYAGIPKKIGIKWNINSKEYMGYIWLDEDFTCTIFEHFYGAHPETKTDFIICINSEQNKYELALFRQGLKEPQIIPEEAYQLIVFKNKFEDYRSDNYNQESGAWMW